MNTKTNLKKLSVKEMTTVKGGANDATSNEEFEYYYDEFGVQQKRIKLKSGGHGNVLL